MNKNLLVLPPEHTKEDQGIWREAIRRGWSTLRFRPDVDDPAELSGYDTVRYYGNILHKQRIEKYLPINFLPISPSLLGELDISWTNRTIKSMRYSELENPLIENRFVKCADVKWIKAMVYPAGTDHKKEWKGMQPNDLIYVQEPYEFINELRGFVLGREIVTASWYRKKKEFCPEYAPLEDDKFSILAPRSMAWSLIPVVRDYHTSLPNGVVIDFGQDGYGHWSVIEINEAWASGLYDADPSKVFDVILASQENK